MPHVHTRSHRDEDENEDAINKLFKKKIWKKRTHKYNCSVCEVFIAKTAIIVLI
jgi:hypothetical protein